MSAAGAERDLIRTPFSAAATADDVLAEVDLRGKRAIVTGGASGIGTETTRALLRRGAHVTVAVRDPDRSAAVLDALYRKDTPGVLDAARLDLTDLASVAAFADQWHEPLDILVNNAGVMALPERRVTASGFEEQLATNFFGHHALMCWLHPHLAAAGTSRVACVSSSGHLFSPVVFDDLNFDFRPYDPVLAYGQSKTAVILGAVAASARWAADGIAVNALNPGAIRTPLQRHVGGTLATPEHLQKSTQQGAATTVLLAAHPELHGVTGRYFSDNQEASVVAERPGDIEGYSTSVAPYALNPETAIRLWDVASEALERARRAGVHHRAHDRGARD